MLFRIKNININSDCKTSVFKTLKCKTEKQQTKITIKKFYYSSIYSYSYWILKIIFVQLLYQERWIVKYIISLLKISMVFSYMIYIAHINLKTNKIILSVFIPSFTYKYLLSAKYCDLSDALVIFTLK